MEWQRAYIKSLVILCLLPVVSAEVVNDRTEIIKNGDLVTITTHSEPYYYNNAGSWDAIGTMPEPASQPYKWGLVNREEGVYFKEKPNSGALININGELTFQPTMIGYVTELGEVGVKVPRNNKGVTVGSMIYYEDFFRGVDVLFSITKNIFYKQIIITDYGTFPPIPESLLPPICYDCRVEQAHGFIDYELLTTHPIIVNGNPYTGGTITTNGAIMVQLSTGKPYIINPGYIVGDYTSENPLELLTNYEVRATSGGVIIRQLLPYSILNSTAMYPLLIDPTFSIGAFARNNSFFRDTGGGEDHSCNTIGLCCSFGGGSCNLQASFSTECVSAFLGSGITQDTHACTGCAPTFPCCKLTGVPSYYQLQSFNWGANITDDYYQVQVDSANLTLILTNPQGTIRARHQDDNDYPVCDLDHNNIDNFAQPSSQTANTTMVFDFTTHVNATIHDRNTKFYTFIDSTSSVGTSKNVIGSAKLTVSYHVDECYAPSAGVWDLDCACGVVSDDTDIPNNISIHNSNSTTTPLLITGHLNFINPESYLIIREPCTVAITGGIN